MPWYYQGVIPDILVVEPFIVPEDYEWSTAGMFVYPKDH